MSFLLFTLATMTIGILAIRDARDLSSGDRWLVGATFCAVLLLLLTNALRPFGSAEFRARAGQVGNRAFVPLVAGTAVLLPVLPEVGRSLLLAAAGAAAAGMAALTGYGLARDITDHNDTRS